MKKIYCENIPELIQSALAENIKGLEFTDKTDANSVLDKLPPTPFKIQDLINLVNSPVKNSLTINSLEIIIDKKAAIYKGKNIGLTEKEISLIEFLNNSDKELSKEDLLEGVWGYSPDTNTRTVETHLHRLNHKFQEEFGFKLIESLNSGYKIANFN